ncbi:hypothetical protein PG995_012238 [Apiospora arundinis]
MANIMSFLAGSKRCELGAGIILRDASFARREPIRSLDGWVFSLGWWARIITEAGGSLDHPDNEHNVTQEVGTDAGSTEDKADRGQDALSEVLRGK